MAFGLWSAPATAIDCGKASGLVEITICHSPSLKKADADLNEAYVRAFSVLTPSERQTLKESQQSWISNRDATCLAGKASEFEKCMVGATHNGTHRLDKYEFSAIPEVQGSQRLGLPLQFQGTYGAYSPANCSRGKSDDEGIVCSPPDALEGVVVKAKGPTVEITRNSWGYRQGCNFVAKGYWNGSFVVATDSESNPARECQVRVAFRGKHLTLRTQAGCDTGCNGWSDTDADWSEPRTEMRDQKR